MKKMFKRFEDSEEAKAFGLALREQGIEPQVRVIPARDEVKSLVPDSAAAEAELEEFAQKGDTLGQRALEWARQSCWWLGPGSLARAADCLESDLDEGQGNGAASRQQASLFLKRLNAALSRAPRKEVVSSSASPPEWEIIWEEADVAYSHDAGTAGNPDGAWGSSSYDGWRVD